MEMPAISPPSFFFFFNDTATTEIYTLSLHDALPIFGTVPRSGSGREPGASCSVESRRSEEHTSELQSRENLVCRLLLEKKKNHVASDDYLKVLDQFDLLEHRHGSRLHVHEAEFVDQLLLFFFIDPATTEIYTLSLHDALPI